MLGFAVFLLLLLLRDRATHMQIRCEQIPWSFPAVSYIPKLMQEY